jgi:hypothetical protein
MAMKYKVTVVAVVILAAIFIGDGYLKTRRADEMRRIAPRCFARSRPNRCKLWRGGKPNEDPYAWNICVEQSASFFSD